MPNITTLTFITRSYEIGHNGTLLHGSMMNYLEEGAVQASVQAGYPEAWFEENGFLWLVRKWMVRYIRPIYLGDELTLQTWVSDFRRVQSHREYVLLRGDEIVLRARTNWVFIDRRSMRPARLLAEFETTYGPIPHEPLEPITIELENPIAVQTTPYRSIYQVRYHEIDRAKHVNNAHYIRWAENNLIHALYSKGVGLSDIEIESHELEYHNSAQFADSVIIESTLVAQDDGRLLWQHKLSHAEPGQVVAVGSSLVRLNNCSVPDVISSLMVD